MILPDFVESGDPLACKFGKINKPRAPSSVCCSPLVGRYARSEVSLPASRVQTPCSRLRFASHATEIVRVGCLLVRHPLVHATGGTTRNLAVAGESGPSCQGPAGRGGQPTGRSRRSPVRRPRPTAAQPAVALGGRFLAVGPQPPDPRATLCVGGCQRDLGRHRTPSGPSRSRADLGVDSRVKSSPRLRSPGDRRGCRDRVRRNAVDRR